MNDCCNNREVWGEIVAYIPMARVIGWEISALVIFLLPEGV